MAILTRSSGSAALSGRLGKPLPVQVRGRVCFIFVFLAGRLESRCQKGGCWDPHSHLPFNPPSQDGDKVFPDGDLVSTQNESRIMKNYGPWSQTVVQIPAPPPTSWVRLRAIH